jgi:hypothetical protein
MSFLRNDGDILIDAVLTDEGRLRLSKGDGSFRVAKFALGDDEIDYGLINMALPSATRDLVLLGSPILEAFTDNAVALRSKLLTIPRTDLLYLPVIALNTVSNPMCTYGSYSLAAPGTFVVCVDQDTENEYFQVGTPLSAVPGVLKGVTGVGTGNNFVRVDQGLDTTEISPLLALDGTLVETQYEISMDSRLGSIVSYLDGSPASVSYVDDDMIAYYILTLSDTKYVSINGNNTTDASEIIDGPRGTTLKLGVKSSIDLAGSDYLFTYIGGTVSMTGRALGAQNVLYIDSYIRVVGLTTGYTLDIPVRFVKLP